MNIIDRNVLTFIAFLARIDSMFRSTLLAIENLPAIRSVNTTVIPSLQEPTAYADEGCVISIALNADLAKPADSSKYAIGMSLLLRHAEGLWIVEAELGWTGREIGWAVFDSKEACVASFEEALMVSAPLVEWMRIRFTDEVKHISTSS